MALLTHYYQGAVVMNVTLDGRTVTLTDEQLSMFGELTKLKQGVAINTLAGMKPADAHRNAGGKCANEANRAKLGSEILNNPEVSRFIETFKTDPSPALARAIMTREDMLSDLTDIANATIFDVMEFHNDGDDIMNMETGEQFSGQSVIHVKSMDKIDPKFHKLIKGVKQTKYGIELILHDSMAARKQIADLCGYDAPKKTELSGPDGTPIQTCDITDEELKDKLREIGMGRYHNQLGGKRV